MVLELHARDSTKDVDALIINDLDHTEFAGYVSRVASEKNLPADWVNDAAKGFIVGPIKTATVLSGVGIELLRPQFVHLLAMKLCAWRDEVDFSDAALLLRQCAGDKGEIWSAVEPHLHAGAN